MRLFQNSVSGILAFIVVVSVLPGVLHAADQQPTGLEIVKNCDNKYPGEDQQNQLTIITKNRVGNERKNVYLRLWKDMKGEDDIVDKMILFTVFPPDASGSSFMRWAYKDNKDKKADQWIYITALRKIRRVSQRNNKDAFLGSELTYGDISYRGADDDNHKLTKIVQDKESGEQMYVVESFPKESDPQYSKRIQYFKKTPNWSSCVKSQVDYYDEKGAFLKRQYLSWQKVESAWVWDKVKVENIQSRRVSLFEVDKVKINRGIEESWFTERRMRLGLK